MRGAPINADLSGALGRLETAVACRPAISAGVASDQRNDAATCASTSA